MIQNKDDGYVMLNLTNELLSDRTTITLSGIKMNATAWSSQDKLVTW